MALSAHARTEVAQMELHQLYVSQTSQHSNT